MKDVADGAGGGELRQLVPDLEVWRAGGWTRWLFFGPIARVWAVTITSLFHISVGSTAASPTSSEPNKQAGVVLLQTVFVCFPTRVHP